jgi:hypothetical protein
VTSSPSAITIVADGVRPDTLAAAIDDGTLPAIARLREEGGDCTITTVFPSVTGPAYTPFLMGRHPGSVGLPGLRWYDRSRTAISTWLSPARSYVGIDMRLVNYDLAPEARTMFELAPTSLGALSVISRGLARNQRIGESMSFVARTALTHFRGDVNGWLAIDRAVSHQLAREIRDTRPAYVFAALTGVDKTSHAQGHDAPSVRRALQIVDTTVAQIRADAERGGYWDDMHLWIVSDHGHAPVAYHDDLPGVLRSKRYRVLAHPWVFTHSPQIAVMVSGNAMAHIYLALEQRTRPFWNALRPMWSAVADLLLARPSVDLMILPIAPHACEIHSRERGSAVMYWDHETDLYTYRPEHGDPLGIGELVNVSADESYDVTFASEYPDALVQISRICTSARAGDIILSAARNWDFRAKYEPIPHVSSHGALYRDHMLVPLITNRPTHTRPRRTVDVMPSAATVLGIETGVVEGRSFF